MALEELVFKQGILHRKSDGGKVNAAAVGTPLLVIGQPGRRLIGALEEGISLHTFHTEAVQRETGIIPNAYVVGEVLTITSEVSRVSSSEKLTQTEKFTNSVGYVAVQFYETG